MTPSFPSRPLADVAGIPGKRRVAMDITKKHLSRRTGLRGVGATVALPFLDAMVPAATALANTAAAPKTRMGFFYLPHGAVMEHWTPAGEGRAFKFWYILEPLEQFRDYVIVFSGLAHKPAHTSYVHAPTPVPRPPLHP